MQLNKNSIKPKILLVEDDVNLGFLLVDYLESQGFEVKLYKDGESGFKGFKACSFDFCILDLMLPKIDGFTLVELIKKENKDIPVIILSARSLKEDKIKGFRLGIDDYITKPFDEDELLFRIHAVLNRSKNSNIQEKPQHFIMVGYYEFNCKSQIIKINGKTQRLTQKENQILVMLSSKINNLVKREEIMISVWGESNYYIGRSLDVFISKLRNYLKDDPRIKVVTIPAVGYVLEIN
jgi:DNA-binding response OmpR family regulator